MTSFVIKYAVASHVQRRRIRREIVLMISVRGSSWLSLDHRETHLKDRCRTNLGISKFAKSLDRQLLFMIVLTQRLDHLPCLIDFHNLFTINLNS